MSGCDWRLGVEVLVVEGSVMLLLLLFISVHWVCGQMRLWSGGEIGRLDECRQLDLKGQLLRGLGGTTVMMGLEFRVGSIMGI